MLDLDIRDFDGEPRMRDLEIAEALTFERPRTIRQLIERNLDPLCDFGVCCTVQQTPQGGGRPSTEYWLNEEQALFICTRSEAKGAIALTKQMVMVFAAWRRGQLPPADVAHGVSDLHPDAYVWRGLIREARLLFGKDRAKWMWAQSPLPQPPDYIGDTGLAPADNGLIVLGFLRECCVVTGLKTDWLPTRDVITAFDHWAATRGCPMGERSLSLALKSVAAGYRDAETGCGFVPHKRNVTGYLGLTLIEGAHG